MDSAGAERWMFIFRWQGRRQENLLFDEIGVGLGGAAGMRHSTCQMSIK
ncbi:MULTISPECIES: hypothetical protein [unclassified Caulobacter]|nr:MULTISPECIES: hypothetical protein [unclassified Caulobacter]